MADLNEQFKDIPHCEPNQFPPGDPNHAKVRLKPSTEAAVIEVLMRIRARLTPSYKTIATKHGIHKQTLKNAVSMFRQGRVVLGTPMNPDEALVDRGAEHDRRLRLLNELGRMINESLEGLLQRAKPFHSKGKLLAYRDMGIPDVLKDMRLLGSVTRETEEGYMSFLEKMQREKEVKAREVTPAAPEAIEQLSDAERARRALQEQAKQTAVDAEIVPPAE